MIKRLKIEPGAISLIESLREIGYDFKSSVADLIDNSISAEASRVYVDINCDDGEFPPFVLIADDGKGMDSKTLKEAMRYATSREYSKSDLGKYGLGLKTASLSQCRILTVASKPKPKTGSRSSLNIMKWDMNEVYAKDEWIVLNPSFEQLERWEQKLINKHLLRQQGHGTVVIWSDLSEIHPCLYKKNPEKMKYLLALIQEAEEHLSMVFHKFMEGSVRGKRHLKITVSQNQLKPWNPFCPDEETWPLDIENAEISYKDRNKNHRESKVIIAPYILPNKDEFSSEKKWKSAGRGNWNKRQGFYFYRNGRMLQSGGWSYLRSSDEHTKLLRVSVDFFPALDRNFGINISKMKASIPTEIKEHVKELLSKWASKANKRYRQGKSAKLAPPLDQKKPPSQNKKALETPQQRPVDHMERRLCGINFYLGNRHLNRVMTSKSGKTGEIKISLPRQHQAALLFKKKRAGSKNIKDFCYALLVLLEAMKSNRIKPKDMPIKKLYEELEKL